MQLLGRTTTESLWWDYSSTECFYLLRIPPLVAETAFYRVTPAFAQSWFTTGTTVYDPFTARPASTIL